MSCRWRQDAQSQGWKGACVCARARSLSPSSYSCQRRLLSHLEQDDDQGHWSQRPCLSPASHGCPGHTEGTTTRQGQSLTTTPRVPLCSPVERGVTLAQHSPAGRLAQQAHSPCALLLSSIVLRYEVLIESLLNVPFSSALQDALLYF